MAQTKKRSARRAAPTPRPPSRAQKPRSPQKPSPAQKPRKPQKPSPAQKPRKPQEPSPAEGSRSPGLAPASPDLPAAGAFPVVGIGASAGGLEAIDAFLRAVPPRCGMAFIVVQHLDPTRKGMLAELLQRVTPLPVVQIQEGMRIEPDHIYVIPPNANLSVTRGVMRLLAPDAPRGLRLPIDFFFRSLADDLRERSVGVVLSGMGSDGTSGLRAIRENAGSTFVQAPTDAKFDSMPRSAIDAQMADVVATAAELPGRIAGYVRHAHHLGRPEQAELDEKSQAALVTLVGLLRVATGHDFAPYKTTTLHRRVERRLGLHQISDVGQYVRYVRDNPEEAQLLFHELLIGVTSFFRDPEAWEQLRAEVLPGLLRKCQPGAVLRAWVPACSTGEEAYSLGIVFREALEACRPAGPVSIQIFATDIDATAVASARQAFYPFAIEAEVSPDRLKRFFVKEDHGYSVSKQIRDPVVFATQNVLQDPPFTRLDLLSCRNLLIYLSADAQHTLMPLFHYCLRPGGTLLLGSAETTGNFDDRFAPLAGKNRFYRRRETSVGVTASARTAGAPGRGARARFAAEVGSEPVAPSLHSRFAQALLQRFAPAAVLTNEKGDVLYVSGQTGPYLEVPAGKTNWNVLAMAREGLRHPLAGGFRRLLHSRRGVLLSGVKIIGARHARRVDVALELRDEPALRGTVLISFTDPAPNGKDAAEAAPPPQPPRRTDAARRVEPDLAQIQHELRLVQADAQTAEEELKSANEELQSTNEELQSTNEELMTSKEEMQSMNEELQSVNSELEVKLVDLARASDDMKNLLDSTDIAVLFLDGALHVRRFTPKATTLIRLIPSDVGRPLADLTATLDYPGLVDDAAEVLHSRIFSEKVIGTKDGRRFSARIMPYTRHDRVDGLVITFTRVLAPGAQEPAGGRP